MGEFKKDYLDKKIKKEVDDLHPLLLELLNRMAKNEKYQKVIHTHGTEEYGADFILIQDDSYGGINNIGVVVKNGSIKAGDLPNVKMQIDQAFQVERIVDGVGKIHINMVFFIVNGSVSNNVKTTLFSAYKSQIVKIIDQSVLINLIDKHFPYFWEDIDGKLAEYLNDEKSRMMVLDSKSSIGYMQSESDAFIPPRLSEMNRTSKSWERQKTKGKSKKKFIDIYEEIRTKNIVLIEAGMGGGKSKLLRQIFLHYVDPKTFQEENIFPLYISFSELYEKYKLDLKSLIDEKTDNIKETIESSKFLILIDSVDEKMLENDEIENSISSLCEIAHSSNIKIVIASRYIGEYEFFCKEHNHLQIIKCTIEPLNTNELVQLIQRLNKSVNITDKLIHDMENKHLFKQMKRTPIVGVILARILQDDKSELPSNLPELYQKYSEIVLGRWDIDKELLSDKEYNVISEVTKKIATDLIENQREYIAYEEFTDYFKHYISERAYSFSTETLINKLTNRSTFFSFDYAEKRVYFRHRSFAEFYYAFGKFNDGGIKMCEDAYNPYWTNIYYFYLGLKKDCDKELKELIAIKPTKSLPNIVKFINFGNFLLASYDTRLKTLQEVLSELILDVGKYANDTVELRVADSPLYKLPKIFVMVFFTYIVTENYSYNLVNQLLENAYVEMSYNENYTNDEKMRAEFILSMLGLELKNKDILRTFLHESRTTIPLEMKLLLQTYISQEEKNKYIEADLELKKMMRSISRNLHNQHHSLIKSLTHAPLNSEEK